MITIDPKAELPLQLLVDQIIIDYLVANNGHRTNTAKALGINVKTLYRNLLRIAKNGKHHKRSKSPR